ncbi:MAG: hypothetical protein ACRCYZ_06765 [Alphaproteobacteria bacterium]
MFRHWALLGCSRGWIRAHRVGHAQPPPLRARDQEPHAGRPTATAHRSASHLPSKSPPSRAESGLSWVDVDGNFVIMSRCPRSSSRAGTSDTSPSRLPIRRTTTPTFHRASPCCRSDGIARRPVWRPWPRLAMHASQV